jgi:hypothetical protein
MQAKIQAILQSREILGKEPRVYMQGYDIPELSARLFPVKTQNGLYLAVWSGEEKNVFERPSLVWREKDEVCAVYPFSFSNYLRLTRFLAHLKPSPFNHHPSFGCGDRLGMVSAAHLKALKEFPVFPVIAQQSPRELQKTRRSFADVLLGAAWGILESGYQGTFGADADHIKDEQDLLEARDLGYSMFTLDLSEKVNYRAFAMDERELSRRYEEMNAQEQEVFGRYRDKKFTLSLGVEVDLSEEKLLPLVLAYLPAVEQVEYWYHLLREELSSFDLEISLDEGESITSPEAHFFMAEELHRRGIDFRSIAPRFPGVFEKGIDYIGDREEFSRALWTQVAVARDIGGYRLSLHSGSDKFSIYPIFFRETGGLFHLKTSGTSWLQGVAVVAEKNPELFLRIYQVAYDTFEENLKAYRLSVRKEELPANIGKVKESDVPKLLRDTRIRQLLHISYGSILEVVGEELRAFLFAEEDTHYRKVCENIRKHLVVLFGEER